MSSIRKVSFWLAMAVLSLSFAGCGNKFFDPSQVGRFRPTPAVNVILDSLGVAEETPVAWENAGSNHVSSSRSAWPGSTPMSLAPVTS